MRWESFSYKKYSLGYLCKFHGIRESRCRENRRGKRWLASDIDSDTATQLVRAHNKAIKEASAA